MSDDQTRSVAPEVVTASSTSLDPGELILDEPERYLIGHQLGAGGMGVVLSATGERLGRPVAVKVSTTDRDDVRRRFEREASVTARLQHPAIVPVYGTGKHKDGRPFYAMKAVSGQPLDKVIAEADTQAKRLALLPNLIAVTEAIAYAHSERVIHRDLKPANVLVGKFGETVVIDWGLAKRLDQSDEPVDAGPYRGDADGTAAGKVMGTPAYMPIEQARGERIDQRADVYALGAMLYHVLAGAAPYRRMGEASVPWESMLARVIAGEPDPLPDDVPPDLAAVVRRAMAREASDRYPSAGELADDLKRFQTGQLVGAHRYSTWQLVKRWARRNRTAVTVGAIAIALLAAVGVFSIVQIVGERDAANAAREVAETARKESDTRRLAAQHLVDYVLLELAQQLAPIGKTKLLAGAGDAIAKYYQATNPETGATVEDRRNHADALNIVARTQLDKGDLAAAAATYADARAILARVLDEEPRDDQTRRVLLTNLEGRWAIAVKNSKLGDVRAILEERIALAKASLDLMPKSAWWSSALGGAERQLADAEMTAGKLAEALEHVKAARAALDRAVALEPNTRAFAIDLGGALYAQGMIEANRARWPEAIAAFDDAVARETAIVDTDPDDAKELYRFSVYLHYAGLAKVQAHQTAQGRAQIRRAIDIVKQLVKRDPENLEWQTTSPQSYEALGEADLADRDFQAAISDASGGLAVVESLLARSKDQTLRYAKASLLVVRLQAYLSVGDAAADADVGHVIDAIAAYAAGDAAVDAHTLATAAGTIADHMREGTHPERGVPVVERLVAAIASAKDPAGAVELATSQFRLARLRGAANDLPGAARSLHTAIAIAEPVFQRDGNPEAGVLAARAYDLLVKAPGTPTEANEMARKGLDIVRALQAAHKWPAGEQALADALAAEAR